MKDQRVNFVAFIALMITSYLCTNLDRMGADSRDDWHGTNEANGNINAVAWGSVETTGRRHVSNRNQSDKNHISKYDIAARIRKYEEENRRLRIDNSILGYEWEDLKKNNANLKNELTRLRDDSEVYSKNAKEIENLNAKIAGNQGQINDLRNQLAQYTNIEKENDDLRKRIHALEGENTEAEFRVSNLNKNIDFLKQRVKDLELQNHEIEELKKTIGELTKTVEEKEKIFVALKKELDTTNTTVEKLQQEINYLEEKLQSELKVIARIRSEIAEANSQITALNREIVELKNSLAKKDEEINSWKGKIQGLEHEVEDLNKKVKSLQDLVADRNEFAKRITYLQAKLAKFQGKVKGNRHDSRRDGWGARLVSNKGGKGIFAVGSAN